MKANFVVSTLLISFQAAWAITDSDLKIIKAAEGFYELQDAKLSKDQKRLCSDGVLELDSDGGLMLGATAIAINVYTKAPEKSSGSEAETFDSCQESITNKMDKNTLTFEMQTHCGAKTKKNTIRREITFEYAGLTYKQKNSFDSKVTEVICELQKVSKEKKRGTWKVDIPEEILEDGNEKE